MKHFEKKQKEYEDFAERNKEFLMNDPLMFKCFSANYKLVKEAAIYEKEHKS